MVDKPFSNRSLLGCTGRRNKGRAVRTWLSHMLKAKTRMAAVVKKVMMMMKNFLSFREKYYEIWGHLRQDFALIKNVHSTSSPSGISKVRRYYAGTRHHRGSTTTPLAVWHFLSGRPREKRNYFICLLPHHYNARARCIRPFGKSCVPSTLLVQTKDGKRN